MGCPQWSLQSSVHSLRGGPGVRGSILFEANQNSMQQKEQLSSFPFPQPLLDGSIRSKRFQNHFFKKDF